ncbi:MAG: HK97 gp10 family phage protein [Terracidiphilus sp.]|jgi:HK97 gp10 family phage protein
MSDGIALKIDTSKFEELLKAMPQRVARRAVRQALQAGGDVLAEAIQANCPVRTDTPTPGSDALPPGILAADISVQVVVGTKDDPTVKVGFSRDTAHVANWIENGFDHVEGGKKRKGGKATKHIDANPFMQRAFDESAEHAVDALTESLATSLEQDLTSETADSGGDDSFGAKDLGAWNS